MIRLFAFRAGRLFVGICFVILVTSLSGLNMIPVASHNPGHGNGGTTNTSSLTLVLLNSTDGLAHWGQQVTFNVSTTATSTPTVDLKCDQGGVMVLAWTAGFFPSYLWTKDVVLSSPTWTGGPASCTATLMYSSNTKIVTLATLPFQVYA